MNAAPDEAAQAVERVKARQQRPADVALDLDAMDVHRHVERAEGCAEQQQRDAQA